MLFTLPIELVWIICHELLQNNNRKVLRLVCRRLDDILRPSVLSHVVINLHERNLDISLLEELSGELANANSLLDQAEHQTEDGDLPAKTCIGNQPPLPDIGTRIPASEFIRGVTVKSLNPRFRDTMFPKALKQKVTRADEHTLALCEQRLVAVIGGLRTLKNVDYLRLLPRDTVGSLAVAEWLLPQCTSFSRLDLLMCGPTPVLDYLILNPTSLGALRSLFIMPHAPYAPPPGPQSHNGQKVSKIISLSPQLRDLTVRKTTHHGLPSLLTKDSQLATLEIFAFTSLSITLGSLCPSNAFTPHMLRALTPNLTSLELMVGDRILPSANETWDDVECLWKYMQPSHLVNLHTLRTNFLSLVMMERLALADYVPRLRVLSILSPGIYTATFFMGPTAKMFFRDVVPALAARKLERLDVQVTPSLEWCFALDTMGEFRLLIQKLDRLVHLGISIISYHDLDSDDQGNMTTLLDLICEHSTLRDLVINDDRSPLFKSRIKCNECTLGYLEGILRYRKKGKYEDLPVISTTSGVVFRPCVSGKMVRYAYCGSKKGGKECGHGSNIEIIL